ncbi:HipA family kinase [Emticicia agri]|uniref:HipA-like kinase domain-containing protein n=1 Tax=Emticicia agri TaxID=2492393 RepID=A0A4Q5LVV9_9BACT|nr:HipA family kinase [Emticicia agri]RYU93822.1 hypothetical protein EWM59_20080 [Emticicia agri]
MKQLHSISEIIRVFPTGDKPVLVICNDLNEWVCKYRDAQKLANELVASEFAKIWGIKMPQTALVKISQSHIPVGKFPNLNYQLFQKECFGTIYLADSKEIDKATLPMFKEKGFANRIKDREDFLKIALFDIWLANEDRNHNNFNLLIHSNAFYAIDHTHIFNTNSWENGMSQLTEEDSIIKTNLAEILFKKSGNLRAAVDILSDKFYLYCQECENRIDEIGNLLPESWLINREEYKRKMRSTIFSNDWKRNCEDNFKTLINIFLEK